MSQITKPLTGFLFNGADLYLADAVFKSNIGTLYGINPAGTGYTSYRPASSFNSLSKLVQDGSYILSATTPGFELDGAVLAAAVAAPGAASTTPIPGFVATSTARLGGSVINTGYYNLSVLKVLTDDGRYGDDSFSIALDLTGNTSYSDSNGLYFYIVRNGSVISKLSADSAVLGTPYRITDDSGVVVYGYLPTTGDGIISYEVPVVEQ